jgi:transcriptional regulator with XRE-family HTH domain
MIISLPSVRPDLEILGQRLRAIREARGLPLVSLARQCEITSADLSLAEHGRLRLTSAQFHALIDVLHVSPRILFEPGIDVSNLRRL